jgi:two-component system sensor kinase FixL
MNSDDEFREDSAPAQPAEQTAADTEETSIIRQLRAELLAARETLERTTKALQSSEERIRSVLDAAIDGIITIDEAGLIRFFSNGAEKIFGYKAEEAIGRNISMLMARPFREKHDTYMQRYLESGEARVIGRERSFRGRRRDGTEFPIQLTQQELTGLGLLARELADSLNSPALARQHELAMKIAGGITEANQNVRRLAKGLMPVPIDAQGLMVALEELANEFETNYGIRCEFLCPSPVLVANDNAAMQLYHVVQEALTNSLKHSGADSTAIAMKHSNATVTITVKDNGIGIDDPPQQTDGLGLRIMQHRCESIGGTFSVRRRKSGGTVVTCEIPLRASN